MNKPLKAKQPLSELGEGALYYGSRLILVHRGQSRTGRLHSLRVYGINKALLSETQANLLKPGGESWIESKRPCMLNISEFVANNLNLKFEPAPRSAIVVAQLHSRIGPDIAARLGELIYQNPNAFMWEWL